MALDMNIDLIGSQLSLYKLYTQLAFVFARSDSQPQSIITDILAPELNDWHSTSLGQPAKW